jgi:hypothetical protein
MPQHTCSQVAVYLVYAPAAGTVVDRELRMLKSWMADPQCLHAAGSPHRSGFATKPQLATRMLARALDTGIPAGTGPSGPEDPER